MHLHSFEHFDRVWFLTWTTYATWLPGDRRGFVSPKFDRTVTEPRNNVLTTEYDREQHELERLARAKVLGDPVYLTSKHAEVAKAQFEETARYRGWTIVAGAVMRNHVHLLVGVSGDPEPATLLRDFKSYASRALNKQFVKPVGGTWWTEQGSKRRIHDPRHFERAHRYVHDQHNALLVWDIEQGQGTDVPRSPTEKL